MNLYVWTDVLRDYGSGMIVALAPDLESALAIAETDYDRSEMGRVIPAVIKIDGDTKPQSWRVAGGS